MATQNQKQQKVVEILMSNKMSCQYLRTKKNSFILSTLPLDYFFPV